MSTDVAAPVTENGAVVGADEQPEVRRTMDYDQFHYDPRNREVYPRHVDTLKEKIQRNNRLDKNPIDVTSDGKVLDGQHRLEAARELGVPIYYRIDSEMSIEDVPHENQAQKSWRPDDYLNYYAESGIEDYQTVREFWERHDALSLTFSAEILAAEGSKNATLRKFRSGEYEVGDVEWAETVARRIEDFFAMGFKPSNKKTFCRSVKQVSQSENYNHDRMLRKAHDLGLQRQPSAKDYLRQFERLFNHSKSERVQLF